MSTQTKKALRRRLTVLVVPHTGASPLQFHLSAFLLLVIGGVWSAVTLWAGYVAIRHVDYWRVKADHQLLKAKVWYFANEVKRSRAFLDQVHEADAELRTLLRMPSRQAIIEDGQGVGGPSPVAQREVIGGLMGEMPEMGWSEIHQQIQAVQGGARNTVNSVQEILRFVSDQRRLFRATPNIWPAFGRLTSRFGLRSSPFPTEASEGEGGPTPPLTGYEFHTGVDVANHIGTQVRATADGVVTHTGWEGGYGRLVIINHGQGYRTFYGHLGKAIFVKPGDHVTRGQIVAEMGSSGMSTGPHVHYEVRHDGKRVDPLRYMHRSTQDKG